MAWTAAKRKSVQGYTPGLGTPYPDATKPAGWRGAVAWLFAADSWPAVVEAVVRRFRGWSPISVSRQNQVTYGRFNQRSQT
jgi:hypothetical protein